MELFIASFLAGVLTVLAPCVVSILPILLARSVDGEAKRSPLAVIIGLSASIIIFTVLLKATTLFIGIPPQVWQIISGGIIAIFGLVTLFPSIWEWVVLRTRFVFGTQELLGKANKQRGFLGDALLGASLGPVFSACSPTYALLVAVVLPVQPITGLLYLVVFVAGLALMLWLIAIFGQKFVKRLGWSINPRGWFRRTLGIVLIVVGVLILTGFDKTLLSWLVESGAYDFQLQLETGLMSNSSLL